MLSAYPSNCSDNTSVVSLTAAKPRLAKFSAARLAVSIATGVVASMLAILLETLYEFWLLLISMVGAYGLFMLSLTEEMRPERNQTLSVLHIRIQKSIPPVHWMNTLHLYFVFYLSYSKIPYSLQFYKRTPLRSLSLMSRKQLPYFLKYP